ncbi:bifunctional polysaccharide deacetylase/glycosyltransferase family 2 protein [Cellulomonas carbonis]|uniref:bifunctional polysaccharide deacetylase/glycosyltransferase family 2 protein n=1 Tax=Cellulomonas carbonis TaxID=1386092 RepID=UPI000ADA1911|nr:bifunctional polysaccharide deacetylase/glycosyltransferase family 2 protein [Cellulomonas carbonis]GGB99331.1 bi-functional transferase/deacetylase [Cellulomonas carbonis]
MSPTGHGASAATHATRETRAARRARAARPGRGTRLPAPHWWLLVVLLLVLLLALAVQASVTRVGAPGGSGAEGTTPSAGDAGSLTGSGPVLLVDDDGALVRTRAAERTVALTFEDGPDARTAAVLDVLAERDVPATFFLTGVRAAEHPELTRQILDAGHEIGTHGWSHRRWDEAPRDAALGQLAVAGATRASTGLARPPYTSTVEALDEAGLSAVRDATADGYAVVLADEVVDARTARTADDVVRALRPPGEDGVVLLLEEGGGGSSVLLDALPRLIDEYTAAGFTFATVSDAVGLTGEVNPPAPASTVAQGTVLLAAVPVSAALVGVVGWSVVVLGGLAALRTLLVVLLARRHVRVSASRVAGEPWLPPVTVLVPAYNEEVGIEATLRSLARSDHPELEVLVIDDGSTDRTGEIAEGLGLPGVRVVRQENGGKAEALRTGTRLASHDVLVMLDGDTVFEPSTVRLLVQPLRDPRVGAVSGNTKVGNRRGLLGRWQHLEYVSGFNLDRRLLDLMRCITTVPGAAGAFRREALEAAGGLSTDTLAEDTDLTMAVLRAGYEVVHEERARAWTEAPSTVRDLWRQRYRWSYGTLQCMWKHRGAVTAGGTSRRLGLVGIPYMVVFQVLLPLVAPAIDVIALYGVLTGDAARVGAVWLGFAAVQVATTAYALRLDRESLRPLWSQPLQQLFYRQLIYLVVIESLAAAVAGARLPWHKLHRSGDVAVPA